MTAEQTANDRYCQILFYSFEALFPETGLDHSNNFNNFNNIECHFISAPKSNERFATPVYHFNLGDWNCESDAIKSVILHLLTAMLQLCKQK